MDLSTENLQDDNKNSLQNHTTSDNCEIILQSAIKLFADKGYDAVGIQEVCSASGITKPTLYYYYKSKQGLLNAIIGSKGAELASKTAAALTYQHDFIKSLTLSLKTTADFARDNPEYFRLHLNLLSAPEGSECYQAFSEVRKLTSQTFSTFFVQSAAEFGNMRGKEGLYSIIFSNLINQTVLAMLGGELILDDDTTYKIIHAFVYGVAS